MTRCWHGSGGLERESVVRQWFFLFPFFRLLSRVMTLIDRFGGALKTRNPMLGRIFRFFRDAPRPNRAGRPLGHPEQAKLGLALSSGGARGLAHVGVLQVLEENGIEVHAISGASMGAYVGALWAAGFSGRELEGLAAEIHDRRQLWKLADPIIPPLTGLFHGLKAKAHLERSLGDLRFEDLERRLLIIACEINSKQRLVLREGRLVDAVHASCAMPGIIAPVTIGSCRCVDGGVVDPLPVGALHKFSDVDRVVAVSVIPTFDEIETEGGESDGRPPPSLVRRSLGTLNRKVNLLAPGNIVDTFRKSISAAQIRLAHNSAKRADLCLRPRHANGRWHDYANFERFIEEGRKITLEHLDEIRELTKSKSEDDESLVGDRVA
jgi:NTE family protein